MGIIKIFYLLIKTLLIENILYLVNYESTNRNV